MQIEYEQSRKHYRRTEFTAKRGTTIYQVSAASVPSTSQPFMQIVEVPEKARNIHFYANKNRLPAKYQTALQDVR